MKALVNFDIIDCKGNIVHSLKGSFSYNFLRIYEKELLNISTSHNIKRTFSNGYIDFYDIKNIDFLDRGNNSRYELILEKQNIKNSITKIEITNSADLSLNLSKAFGINENIVNQLLLHHTEIKNLFEEHNFLTADSLVVAKDALLLAKNKENQLDLDRALNIINALITIFSLIK